MGIQIGEDITTNEMTKNAVAVSCIQRTIGNIISLNKDSNIVEKRRWNLFGFATFVTSPIGLIRSTICGNLSTLFYVNQ